MFSTFSAISTPESDTAPRRNPWRAILVILLLLAAGAYLLQLAPPVMRQYRATQQDEELTWTGVVAEAVEGQLNDTPTPDAHTLASLITPSFAGNANLAFVRVWSPTEELLCEVTRDAPEQPRAGNDGSLPDLGVRERWTPLQERMARGEWVEPIVQMQALAAEQSELTATLEAARERGGQQPAVVSHCAVLQRQVLALANVQAKEHPLLAASTREMNRVLVSLATQDDDALTQAADASGDAETGITQTLEAYRATTDTLASLPAPLVAAAPRPAWWVCWWPGLRGHRALVPLFRQDEQAEMVVPAGYAEVVCYDRQADLIAALAVHSLPALGLLLAALLTLLTLLIHRRRPRAS